MTAYLLERAYVGGTVEDDVLVEIEDGRFTSVTPRRRVVDFEGKPMAAKSQFPRSAGETDGPRTLAGLTVPGLANAHSHAFHRALRGRTQRERGTFWTWRSQMYAAAQRLDPDSYFALARAVYREMVAAGITTVGEFHYLHHRPGGSAYDNPNAMGEALLAAASEAGLRICLLDTVYLSGGFGEPVTEQQAAFSDGSVDAWVERVDHLTESDTSRIGAAIHSVRAVPADVMPAIAEWAADRPLHVHVSEQVAENEACVAAYVRTPVELLADHGVLGPHTTAVHATHLDEDDLRLLNETGTTACFTPTTERDLGDGVGPGTQLTSLSLGSDSHAVIDLFEEMRALELDERLVSQERGHWTAEQLLAAGTRHDTLGFSDAGRIEVGARADLVTLDTASVRTAGTGADLHTAVFAATAEDVTSVVVDGRLVHTGDRRAGIGAELAEVIGRLWS
jgi:formiminoglutamate deiminase